MGLASGIHYRETPPGEPNDWLEFEDIGYAALQLARQENQRQWQRSANEMRPEHYQAMLRSSAERAPEQQQAVKPDPFTLYDPITLLDRAVVAWSYDPALPPRADGGAQQKARLELLGKLHADTLEWAARTVLAHAGIENAWPEQTNVIEVEAPEGGRIRGLNGSTGEPDPTWQLSSSLTGT